jgi:hypothetical protein
MCLANAFGLRVKANSPPTTARRETIAEHEERFMTFHVHATMTPHFSAKLWPKWGGGRGGNRTVPDHP